MMGRLHNIIVIAAFAVVAAVPGGPFPGLMPDPGPIPGPGPGPFPSLYTYPRIVNTPKQRVKIAPGISDELIPRPQRGSGSQTSPTQSGFQPFTQSPGGELSGSQPVTQRPGVELASTTLRTQPGSVQKHVSCGLNPSPGECQAAFPRYYYNSTTSQCDCYLFGGCDEEEGSYRTLEECDRKCLPSLKEEGPVCRLVYIDNIVPFSPPTTTTTTTSSPDANYPTENNRPATTTPPLVWSVFPEGGRPSSGGPSSVSQPTTTTFKPTGNRPSPTSSFGNRRPTTVKTTGNRPTAGFPRVPLDPHVAFPDDGHHSSDSDYESYDF